MSFSKTIEHFEHALQVAEAEGDSTNEGIAAGLIELTRTLRSELASIKQEIERVRREVR